VDVLRRFGSVSVGIVLVGALVTVTAQVQEYRFRPYLYDNLYLPSGKFVEQASVGYHQLAADLVWFQAVQYFGGYAKSEHSLAYFEGLIDIVTDLDPHFIFPYIFGSVVMAQDMGELEHGVELLKKGMRCNPQQWSLPFEIGFLNYVVHGDADVAMHYFSLASKLPGGGDRGQRFAAFAAAKVGRVETSIRMWEELAATTDQPYMREMAKRYIGELRRNGKIQKETR
jgi:hypothetical protein